MPRDISDLNPQELQRLQAALRTLITQMNARKSVGSGASGSGLIPDEEIVLKSLSHPERGDVLLTVLREPSGRFQIFVSNRRDPENPFAVMDEPMLRDFPGRRALNGRTHMKEGEYGLFLITVQDREMLRARKEEVIEAFSAHFKLHADQVAAPRQADELRAKPLAQCDLAEKWQIYKKSWPGDSRAGQIEQELLSFPLTFARYKQAQKSEMLTLPPDTYRERIGQLIRDVYPGGIRTSLRRDYPKEHQERLQQARSYIQSLAMAISGKIFSDNPRDMNRHLEEVVDFLKDVLENDPELSHFT
jgi:hypothetical protein